MSLRGSYLIILVVCVSLFFGVNSAFGQISESIVVTTDKASYSEGEIILITGEVRPAGTPVSLIITNPNGDLVSISQQNVAKIASFLELQKSILRAKPYFLLCRVIRQLPP